MTARERPIIFSGPMVRAILDGSKTQTRRIAKEFDEMPNLDRILQRFPHPNGCRHGTPGDRLWVRETWAPERDGTACPDDTGILYRATDLGWDDEDTGLRWRPSIFMPRTASRILLEITDVRVQRLQDISEDDARAEGIDDDAADKVLMMAEAMNQREPRPLASAFETIWDTIHGSGAWHANPWVWALTFRRLQP
jgi:hypothetical protein